MIPFPEYHPILHNPYKIHSIIEADLDGFHIQVHNNNEHYFFPHRMAWERFHGNIFMNYYNQGHITKTSIIYASVMSVFFLAGGYLGSKWALKLNENIVKLVFGVILMYVAIRMIINGWSFFSEEK